MMGKSRCICGCRKNLKWIIVRNKTVNTTVAHVRALKEFWVRTCKYDRDQKKMWNG